MQPRLVGVFPAFDHDLPFAQLTLDGGIIGIPRLQIAVFADLDHGFPAVEARIGAGHGETFNLAAACVTHGHGRSCLGAAFDEHLGGDVECFAELHACREQAVLTFGVMSSTFTRPNCSGLVRSMTGAGASPTVCGAAAFALVVRLRAVDAVDFLAAAVRLLGV